MERELWIVLYEMARKLDRRSGQWKYATADIVVVYFWCVLHDRPMVWGTDRANWPDDLCPAGLPTQSTLSRRMRRPDTLRLLIENEQTWLALGGTSQLLIRMIDGKPLGVSGVSKDADARYGRGAGGMQKGYKFYAVWRHGCLASSLGFGTDE